MELIVEFVKDKNKRQCKICKNNIKKGSIIMKLECTNPYCSTNKIFYHIDCIMNKLKNTKEKFENIVPKNKIQL